MFGSTVLNMFSLIFCFEACCKKHTKEVPCVSGTSFCFQIEVTTMNYYLDDKEQIPVKRPKRRQP